MLFARIVYYAEQQEEVHTHIMEKLPDGEQKPKNSLLLINNN